MTTGTLARERSRVTRTRGSYQDYLAWPAETRIVEWKDGEIVEYMPRLTSHQNVARFLLALLDALR